MGLTAILLAAGRGERLRPYTDDRPKCLVELGGMTLLERQLATLRGCGIEDIVIITGYRDDTLKSGGLRRAHNARWQTTNMVETLFCAEDTFGDDMIVAYTDIVYEPRILAALLDSADDCSVVVDRAWRTYWEHRYSDPLIDAESLQIDNDGRITEIGGPVADADEIDARYVGLMRFRGPGIGALKSTRAILGSVPRQWMEERPIVQAYMTDLLMEMILTGHAVHAVETEGGWLEIDTVDDYENARFMMTQGTLARFYDPSSAETPAA